MGESYENRVDEALRELRCAEENYAVAYVRVAEAAAHKAQATDRIVAARAAVEALLRGPR